MDTGLGDSEIVTFDDAAGDLLQGTYYPGSVLWYAIGSLSGMIGSLQGLLILTLVSLLGNPIQRLGRSALFTAVFQSFLLQLLILPQGVLFAFR